jgi:hypothetical protein
VFWVVFLFWGLCCLLIEEKKGSDKENLLLLFVCVRCVFLGELAEGKSSAGARANRRIFKFKLDQHLLVSFVFWIINGL